MTIKLLTPRGQYPVNAIVTFDAATEAALVADKVATTNLTGGTAYVAPAAGNTPQVVSNVSYAGGKLFDGNGNEITSLVSGAWNRIPSLGQTMVVMGDSYAFQCNGGAGPGGLTFTRTAGVVVVTGATSHPMYSGALISPVGLAAAGDLVQKVPATYISSSSFSYPSAGADGVLSQVVGASVILHHQYQSQGFWSHFNRLTNGAYKLVQNAGFPGETSVMVASKALTHLVPYAPQRVVWFSGYNDLTAGLTVAQTVAGIKSAVDAWPSALWDIFSTAPFNSGAANNTTANLRKISRYYSALKAAFAGYANVRVHNTLALWGLPTGLAKTGYINTGDNIHPSPRGMYEAAAYLVALDAKVQTPIQLPYLDSTVADTRALDAASPCLVDNPMMAGTGGSAITNVTGSIPTGYSGALSSTGNATTGTATLPTRPDGFGVDWTITYTPATADTVLRMSYALNVARFVSGATIDSIVMKVSVSGVVAGNIKNMQIGLVWITEQGTFATSSFEAVNPASTINHMQQADVVDLVFCLRDVKVPVFATLSTARLDFTIGHFAAGTAVVAKLAQAQVTLAA